MKSCSRNSVLGFLADYLLLCPVYPNSLYPCSDTCLSADALHLTYTKQNCWHLTKRILFPWGSFAPKRWTAQSRRFPPECHRSFALNIGCRHPTRTTGFSCSSSRIECHYRWNINLDMNLELKERAKKISDQRYEWVVSTWLNVSHME